MNAMTACPLDAGDQTLTLRLSASDLGFTPRSAWNPSPSVSHRTEPYDLPITLDVGIRGNEACGAKFSPPPFAIVVLGADARALVHVVAEGGWHRWNQVRFTIDRDGVGVEIDLEGQSDPREVAPHVQVAVTLDEQGAGLHELLGAGLAAAYPRAGEPRPIPDWWLRPSYCGWGDQVGMAMHLEGVGAERRANPYCTQGLYERWIRRLEQANVPIGTVTVDAGWSPAGWWEADQERWPDLRQFVDRQHQAGRRVLLWLATWLWDRLPDDWCLFVDGFKLTADPTHPRYREQIRRWVDELLSPDGYDADGFKIDQLAFCPSRQAPYGGSRFGWCRELPPSRARVRLAQGELWGCELLYQLQRDICLAAKAAKPDCLITSSTVHPYFADTFDMVRLHDMGEVAADIFAAMQSRADLSRAALPHAPIDADDWVHSDYDLWLRYTRHSGRIGVPCTLYAEHFVQNWKSEPATRLIAMDDLRAIGDSWRGYLAQLKGR
jgi:hypothetical protein